MAFTNIQLDFDSIPSASELVMTPLPAAYRREVLVQCLIILVPVCILSLLLTLIPTDKVELQTFFRVVPMVTLPVAFLLTALAVRQAAVQAFALREHDIAFRQGLFFRKQTILPFNRVQHMEVSSGPLQRRFGLASLKFFTAGGISVDLKISGLVKDDAERIRAFILERKQGGIDT